MLTSHWLFNISEKTETGSLKLLGAIFRIYFVAFIRANYNVRKYVKVKNLV